MHWHDALGRKDVIQRGEHSLLHFAGVQASTDQHDLARKIEGDHGFAPNSMALGICPKTRAPENCEIGNEIRKFASIRAYEQGPDKEGMPGLLGKDPGSQSVADIGTCPEILGKQGLSRAVRDEIVQQHLKLLRCHLSVVVPQTESSVWSSNTMYLSLGLRP